MDFLVGLQAFVENRFTDQNLKDWRARYLSTGLYEVELILRHPFVLIDHGMRADRIFEMDKILELTGISFRKALKKPFDVAAFRFQILKDCLSEQSWRLTPETYEVIN